jgi:succinate dehydrogenase / fumarate reductase iron-sulfur subunit
VRAGRKPISPPGAGPAAVVVRIRRQDGPARSETRRWELFEVERKDLATVADLLDRINLQPCTVTGDAVEPIVWESCCTWPTCGSCSIVINRRAELACATTIDDAIGKHNTITLEPLSKFPLRRDLWVDRSQMARDRARLVGWVEPLELSEAATESEVRRRERLALTRCTACGCCLEACPEYRPGRAYAGAAAISYAWHGTLFSAVGREARLDGLVGPHGIASCGRAENCVEICPHQLPLDDVLAQASRGATKHWLKHLLRRRRTTKG